MTQPRNSHGLIRSSMEQNISSQSSGDRGVKKMHGSIFGKQGRSFPHDPAHRGYHVVYRENEVNHCPGCGRSHWYVGRVSAECGFCGTALPGPRLTLMPAPSNGAGRHGQAKAGGRPSSGCHFSNSSARRPSGRSIARSSTAEYRRATAIPLPGLAPQPIDAALPAEAGVAELVDALDLGSSGQPWGFESLRPHQLRGLSRRATHPE